MNYAEWAAETYEKRIAPVIKSLAKEISPNVNAAAWLDACDPGPSLITRYRLFPGSLFLLWVEALQPGADRTGTEFVAAAIELLHNASLVHDDLLDEHMVRKGQPTLLSLHGRPVALLAGDGLFAASLQILAKLPADKTAAIVNRLGGAMEKVVAGQLLDEPAEWKLVPLNKRYKHWIKVCEGKLSLGNIPGNLAACWAGKENIEKDIEILLSDFSVVSQVINDFGDLFDFSGYQTSAPSLRVPGEESLKKPTLPLIWANYKNTSDLTEKDKKELVQKAHDEINDRKEIAIRRLAMLPVSDPGKILYSFFNSPSMPV